VHVLIFVSLDSVDYFIIIPLAISYGRPLSLYSEKRKTILIHGCCVIFKNQSIFKMSVIARFRNFSTWCSVSHYRKPAMLIP